MSYQRSNCKLFNQHFWYKVFLWLENVKINVFIQNYSFWIHIILSWNFIHNMQIWRKIIVTNFTHQMIFVILMLFFSKIISELAIRKIFNAATVGVNYEEFRLNKILSKGLILRIILFILSWVKDASIFQVLLFF